MTPSRSAALAMLGLAAACSRPSADPTLSGVTPDRGPADRAVEVTITGTGLAPFLVTDFTRRRDSVLDMTVAARLGREVLIDVRLAGDGTVAATVPAGLSPGLYELTLVVPGGKRLTLVDAYRVLTPAEAGLLVDRYRFEPVGPQQVGVPFAVMATAVDVSGVVVDGYSGLAQLSDLTGTVVPRQVGPFVRGAWTGQVEVRALRPDDALRLDDAQGRTGSSNTFSVGAGAGSRLVFATPPRTAVAGTCSAPVRLEQLDATGAPAPAPTDVVITLAASPPAGFALFVDPACSQPLVQARIAVGQTDTFFYFMGRRAGPVLVTASSAGLQGAAQVEQVSPAPPSKIVFTTADPTLNAGTCSAPATVQVRDAFDNPSPVSAAMQVALAATPGSGLSLFAAGSCSTPQSQLPFAAGADSADFQMQGTTAATYTVTATSGTLGSARLTVRVNPAGFPTQLAFVSPPQTVDVGICSGPLAVQTQDALGNAVAGPASVQAVLSAAPGAGFSFYADAACTTAVTSVSLGGGGASTQVVHFRGNQAGAVTVTASAAGLQSAAQVETLQPGPALRLAFTSPPRTVVAGSCSMELRLRLEDSLGNTTNAAAATAVTFLGGTFFSDAACTVAASAFTLMPGQGSGGLFLRATAVGAVQVDATSPGLIPAQQVETVVAAPPAALSFVSMPQSVGVGACSSAAQLEVRDAYGNTSPVAMATSAALTAAPASGFAFFSDPGCLTPSASAPIAAAASTGVFFFRGSALGNVAVTATIPGLIPAQQTQAVVAGLPVRLVFTTPSRTALAGACSQAVTVEVQDAAGNPSPLGAATLVSVTSTPAAPIGLFSDPGCVALASSFNVPMAGTTARLYFRSSLAAAYVLRAAATGLTDGLQAQTVVPGPAVALAFSTPPRSANAGACSQLLTVARKDAFGNDAPEPSAATVDLTASPAAGFSFHSDPACGMAVTSVAIGAAAATADVYFRGTTAGTVMLNAASAPLTPATQTAVITPAAAPTQLVFTTPPRTVTAGGCSSVLTVQSRDSFNNPRVVAVDTGVAFSGVPAAGTTFYSDALCAAPATQLTLAAGMDTLSFYFRAIQAGALDVTAAAAGLNPATQTQTVSPAPPDRLVFTTAPQTLVAGGCSATATVQPRDAYGNASPAAVATPVSLTASGGGGVTFFTDASCTMAAASVPLGAGMSSASFYFRGTQTGARTLSAAVTGWLAATQGATFTAGAAVALFFTTPPRTVAAGTCSAVLTVEARDALGNPAPVGALTAVALAAMPAAGFAFYSDSGCLSAVGLVNISAGGTNASFWVRGTAAGSIAVTGTAAGLSPASQTATVTAAAASQLVFVTPSRTITAGGCSLVATVEVRDPFGNPVPQAAPLTLMLAAAPALGFTFHSDAACSAPSATATVAVGQSQAWFHFSGTNSGNITLTVTSGGLTPASQGATVNAGPAASFQWLPIASPRSLDTPFGVTVIARDAFGNVAVGFTGTAGLSMAPAGTVNCTSACTDATTTDVFGLGQWTGSVTLSTAAAVGTGRTLTATQGVLNGTSNAFDVTGAAPRSPPIARFTWGPAVIDVGSTVSFDASASSDYQTPRAALEVSWDFQDTGISTLYTTTKTASFQYNTAGFYRVSLHVRDADGDIGYEDHWVRVLAVVAPRCTVSTNSDVDDGASSCTGPYGTDSQLSLREVIRIANATGAVEVIRFRGPMTITGTGNYVVTDDFIMYAQPGVLLVGVGFDIRDDVDIYGLEMSGQTNNILVASGDRLRLFDVYLHDLPGIEASGDLVLDRITMANCGLTCVRQRGSGRITLVYGELKDSPGRDAVRFDTGACNTGTILTVTSTTFRNFGRGIRMDCSGTLVVRHNTFDQVATGLQLTGGAGNILQSNIFSASSSTAATCGAATFTTRSHHVLFANSSNGCLASDPSVLTTDPLYAFPSVGDLRLSFPSPAKDSAPDLGLDLSPGLPGNFIGPSPDRGGRETW